MKQGRKGAGELKKREREKTGMCTYSNAFHAFVK